VDAALSRFLARHSLNERESVEKDVAELRHLGPEATWRIIDSVCRSAADILSMRPDRLAVLREVTPPHPSYAAVMSRLRAGYRNARA